MAIHLQACARSLRGSGGPPVPAQRRVSVPAAGPPEAVVVRVREWVQVQKHPERGAVVVVGRGEGVEGAGIKVIWALVPVQSWPSSA